MTIVDGYRIGLEIVWFLKSFYVFTFFHGFRFLSFLGFNGHKITIQKYKNILHIFSLSQLGADDSMQTQAD